jgi:toxin-antitoxin system PIN domain toxin
MIATDTNLLVHAHRADSEWHEAASACIRALAEGRSSWGIPWPCVHEFLAIVTHPNIYDPPSRIEEAVDQVDAWLASPVAYLLTEGASHWTTLRDMLTRGQIRGPLVHDARIAALCVAHGVRELWTADRDFTRFPELTTHNPLLA